MNVPAAGVVAPTVPFSAPENPAPVTVKAPVDGLKLNFVEVTFAGKFPVFAVTQTGYIVALVEASSVMPMFVLFVALVADPTARVF